MDAIWQAGIQFIVLLQGLGEWLELSMQFFSFLGYEEFFLIFAPAIYWCLDPALGLRLGLLLMASNGINAAFKLLIHHPRPFWLSTQVTAMTAETSFGIPSGHAQHAVVVWGTLAAWFNKSWGWAIAGAIMFLIGLSRLYLGVHFPTDVLAGWLLGGLIMWAYARIRDPLEKRLHGLTVNDLIIIALAGSLTLAMVGSLSRLALLNWQIPVNWVENAVQALPVDEDFNPLELSGVFTSAGAFFGLAAGYILLQARGGLDARGPWFERLLRFILGAVGAVIIWMGLGAIFPRGEDLLAYTLRYLRYGFLGFWVTYLAPLVFIRLRLARHRQ